MNEQDSLQVLTQLGFRDLQHERTIKSSVTTAWGVDWDEEFVARDLMQNFFDANHYCVHEIKIETAGGDIKVSAPAVYNLERLYYLGSEKAMMMWDNMAKASRWLPPACCASMARFWS